MQCTFLCIIISYITLIYVVIASDGITDHPNWKLVPTKKCGKGKLSDRIVGGDTAAVGQFPWIARLGYKDSGVLDYLCAGSLITETVVVTAAHCVVAEMRKRLFNIRLGEHDALEEIDCDNGGCAPKVQDIRIRRVILHPNYDYRTVHNDIALIFLRRKAKINGFVMPVCLPQDYLLDKNFNLTGTVEVAGWGDIDSFDSYYPAKLRYVAMEVEPNSVCEMYNPDTEVDRSQYCVGQGDGKDSCVGDSGGPMMQVVSLKAPPRYFLFGLVSYGAPMCGDEAAVYTSIPYYMDWILDNLTPYG